MLKNMTNKQGIEVVKACHSCIFHDYNIKHQCYCTATGQPHSRTHLCKNWQMSKNLQIVGHHDILSTRPFREVEYFLWHLKIFYELQDLIKRRKNKERVEELKNIFKNPYEYWKLKVK